MPDLPSPTTPVNLTGMTAPTPAATPYSLVAAALSAATACGERRGVDGAADDAVLDAGEVLGAEGLGREAGRGLTSSLGADPHDLGVERDAGDDGRIGAAPAIDERAGGSARRGAGGAIVGARLMAFPPGSGPAAAAAVPVSFPQVAAARLSGPLAASAAVAIAPRRG